MLFKIMIADGTGEFSKTGIFDAENQEAAIKIAKLQCDTQWPTVGTWMPVPHKGEEWPPKDAIEFFFEPDMWDEDQVEDAVQYDHTIFMYAGSLELNTFFSTEE